MAGHLVNALDGAVPAGPMLESVQLRPTRMAMHIGPPVSVAPLMVNVGGDPDQRAVTQAAADNEEGRAFYFEDKRQKEDLERQLLSANAELESNR
jgi:hypothetical protein